MNLFKAILICSLGILLTGCSFTSSSVNPVAQVTAEPLRETRFMMGTTVTISLFDNQDQTILDKAFSRIKELEDQLSINKSNTLLDEVNGNAGVHSTPVNADLFDILQKGLYYSQLTEGSFDITIGPLVKLWNIGFPEAKVPSQNEIDKILPLVDYSHLTLDDTSQSIYLEKKGMIIDLGGIAKGYAADEVTEVLKENGVNHAIVDLGGNVYTLGTKVDGSLWKVGIQDPFNPRGDIIGHIPVSNKSVVTSGIYERYLEEDGKKYHHILNPDTGYPFDNSIAGVTIVSDYSIDGDALSTSVFSKGIQEGLEFVEMLSGIEAIFISTHNAIYVTEGLKDSFTLTNNTFKLKNE